MNKFIQKKWVKTLILMSRHVFIAWIITASFAGVLAAHNVKSQKLLSDFSVTLNEQNTSLFKVLNKIEKQTNFKFSYLDGLDQSVSISVEAKNASLFDVLETIAKKGKVEFLRVNDMIAVSEIKSSSGNLVVEDKAILQREITGQVTDESGNGLPGASILVKGQTLGTTTDLDGNYSLSVPEDAVIVVSFVGYKSQEIAVGNQSIINVQLGEDASQLDEIVVTAFGIEKEKKALGYSAQEIGPKDLEGARDINVSSYLTAKVAGVQVSKPASGVGGSTNVVIRGNSSISGSNQPLYVVDGIPIINFSNDSPGAGLSGSGDYDYGDGIGDINPLDVESMSVLKGPAATALYGSRGANGVVLITTKSGKGKRGIGVEINSNVTMEELNLFPNYQNQYGSGYGDEGVASFWSEEVDGELYPFPDNGNLDNWGGPLDGSIKIIDRFLMPDEEGQPYRTMDYVSQPKDNVRDFFETGVTISNNVAVTGANDAGSMRLSVGNSSTSGIIPNHEIKKKSVSFRGSLKVNKVITVEGKVNYLRTEGNQRPATGYSQYNPIWNFAIMSRFTPLDYVKRYYEETKSYNRPPGMNYSPWYIVNEIKNSDVRDRFVGYTAANIKFTEWLTLNGRIGLDFYADSRFQSWKKGARGNDQRNGRMIETMGNRRELNADLILTANKNLNEDFSLTASLGTSLWNRFSESRTWDAREAKIDEVYHISNYLDVRPSASQAENEIQSVFATAQLGYRNFLFLDLTGRNDWSSTLGVNNQSFFYPSVSTSFVFSDAFNISQEVLSFGKVRLSWAQVGASAQPYLTTSGYSFSNENYNGQPYASKSGQIPLFDLKNELTTSWEVGTDLRFFQNKIGLDITYYNASTSNQILELPISNASGYTNQVINAGEIQNQGVEVTLNLTPIKTMAFQWDVNANFATNNSMVVELDGNIQTYKILDTNDDSWSNDVHAEVGAPYGNIIGYKYLRNEEGRKIVSSGGEYQRESEVSVLGNINPDWIGGLNNTFSYKGFNLNVLLDFVQGGDFTSHTKRWMTQKGTGAWTVEGRRPKPVDENGNQLPYVGVLDGVVDNGDGTYSENTQAVPGQKYWASRAWSGIGEEFVVDGSYISLREVILGYSFPRSIISKTPFTTLSLSIIGRNLAYLMEHTSDYGIAPESAPNTSGGASGVEALAVPSTRSFGVNIKLGF